MSCVCSNRTSRSFSLPAVVCSSIFPSSVEREGGRGIGTAIVPIERDFGGISRERAVQHVGEKDALAFGLQEEQGGRARHDCCYTSQEARLRRVCQHARGATYGTAVVMHSLGGGDCSRWWTFPVQKMGRQPSDSLALAEVPMYNSSACMST